MQVLRTTVTPSRIALGLAALVLMVAAGAGCGDDDSKSTNAPPGSSTPTSSQVPTPAAQPDLIIGNVSVKPPGPLVPPGQVQISATVSNIGAADYNNWIVVQAPGNQTGGINGLAAGASEVAVIDFPVVSPNVTFTLSLIVDPDNVIAEESESNNESATIVINTGP